MHDDYYIQHSYGKIHIAVSKLSMDDKSQCFKKEKNFVNEKHEL